MQYIDLVDSPLISLSIIPRHQLSNQEPPTLVNTLSVIQLVVYITHIGVLVLVIIKVAFMVEGTLLLAKGSRGVLYLTTHIMSLN